MIKIRPLKANIAYSAHKDAYGVTINYVLIRKGTTVIIAFSHVKTALLAKHVSLPFIAVNIATGSKCRHINNQTSSGKDLQGVASHEQGLRI